MEAIKKVKLQVLEQGNPVVGNVAYIQEKGKNIVAINVGMTTKYFRVVATTAGDGCCPSVILDIDHGDRSTTELEFPEYGEAWDIFTAQASKYLLRVVLIRNRKPAVSTHQKLVSLIKKMKKIKTEMK